MTPRSPNAALPDVRALLLSSTGRIGRMDFAAVGVMLVIGGAVAHMVPVVGPLLGLAFLWPWTCLAIRRLHDMGRTGRLAALPLSLSVATDALGMMTEFARPETVIATAALTALVATVAMLVGLAFIAWIALTPGEAVPNRFGAPAPSRIAG